MTTSTALSEAEMMERTRRPRRPRRMIARRSTTISLPLEIDALVWRESKACGKPMTDIVVAALAAHWADRLPADLVAALQLKPKDRDARQIPADALFSLDPMDEEKIQKTAA